MRIAPWLVAGLALAVTASAQTTRSRFEDYWARYQENQALRVRVYARANELRPRRRDAPMRYVGISDNEMREIQQVALEYVPRALVNFSPIVTGCPCEEGPQCKDQIYILANRGQTTVGLELVRIEDTWKVGSVQTWWLKRDRLSARRRTLTEEQYDAAELELLRQFPACLAQSAIAASAAVAAKAEQEK